MTTSNNTEKQFVPYTLALKLKELGFDEPCFVSVDSEGKNILFHDDHTLGKNSEILYGIYLPLWQQAFEWMREKYLLLGYVNTGFCPFKDEPSLNGFKGFIKSIDLRSILSNGSYFKKIETTYFKTYEEAQEECLTKLIEIVQDEK